MHDRAGQGARDPGDGLDPRHDQLAEGVDVACLGADDHVGRPGQWIGVLHPVDRWPEGAAGRIAKWSRSPSRRLSEVLKAINPGYRRWRPGPLVEDAGLSDRQMQQCRSSTSRYDSAKRRYQRTASTITSGGKRKPAKADRGSGAGRGRRGLMPTVSRLEDGHHERNSARRTGRRGASDPTNGRCLCPVDLDDLIQERDRRFSLPRSAQRNSACSRTLTRSDHRCRPPPRRLSVGCAQDHRRVVICGTLPTPEPVSSCEDRSR